MTANLLYIHRSAAVHETRFQFQGRVTLGQGQSQIG